jgi:hypothetical protein
VSNRYKTAEKTFSAQVTKLQQSNKQLGDLFKSQMMERAELEYKLTMRD